MGNSTGSTGTVGTVEKGCIEIAEILLFAPKIIATSGKVLNVTMDIAWRASSKGHPENKKNWGCKRLARRL